jgi:choline dehydrogenase-like flavoprotein
VLTDSSSLDPSALRQADVVVVGAGAVGLTMAVDLARAGKDVIVLEAGGKTVEKSSQSIFEAASRHGYPLEGLHFGRLRALGGTTNAWAGQLIALDPIVFEERPWVADIGWPISRADLDEAYGRAFGLVGLSRQISDEAVLDPARNLCRPRPEPDMEFLLTLDARTFVVFRQGQSHQVRGFASSSTPRP